MKHLRITVEGKTYEVEVELLDEQEIEKKSSVHPESSVSMSDSNLTTPESKQLPKTSVGNKNVIASPLSAVVVSIHVSVGETVEAGQKVITLEAMKMNTIVTASVAGTIEKVLISESDSVEEGQALMDLG